MIKVTSSGKLLNELLFYEFRDLAIDGLVHSYHISDYKSGNNYGHSQKSTKEETKGEYSFLLPDGRVQTVKYYANDSGFHADVSYQNVH